MQPLRLMLPLNVCVALSPMYCLGELAIAPGQLLSTATEAVSEAQGLWSIYYASTLTQTQEGLGDATAMPNRHKEVTSPDSLQGSSNSNRVAGTLPRSWEFTPGRKPLKQQLQQACHTPSKLPVLQTWCLTYPLPPSQLRGSPVTPSHRGSERPNSKWQSC